LTKTLKLFVFRVHSFAELHFKLQSAIMFDPN